MFSPASCCISGCASLSSSLSGGRRNKTEAFPILLASQLAGLLGVSEVDLGKLVEVEALAD